MNFYDRYDLSEKDGMHYNLSKLKNRQKHGLHQASDEELKEAQDAWDSYELDTRKKQLVQ